MPAVAHHFSKRLPNTSCTSPFGVDGRSKDPVETIALFGFNGSLLPYALDSSRSSNQSEPQQQVQKVTQQSCSLECSNLGMLTHTYLPLRAALPGFAEALLPSTLLPLGAS